MAIAAHWPPCNRRFRSLRRRWSCTPHRFLVRCCWLRSRRWFPIGKGRMETGRWYSCCIPWPGSDAILKGVVSEWVFHHHVTIVKRLPVLYYSPPRGWWLMLLLSFTTSSCGGFCSSGARVVLLIVGGLSTSVFDELWNNFSKWETFWLTFSISCWKLTAFCSNSFIFWENNKWNLF